MISEEPGQEIGLGVYLKSELLLSCDLFISAESMGVVHSVPRCENIYTNFGMYSYGGHENDRYFQDRFNSS